MMATAQILDFPHPVDGQSCGEKPNVSRRKYLSPDEARRVIDAAGRIGRQRARDQLLLTMMYRHGPWTTRRGASNRSLLWWL